MDPSAELLDLLEPGGLARSVAVVGGRTAVGVGPLDHYVVLLVGVGLFGLAYLIRV